MYEPPSITGRQPTQQHFNLPSTIHKHQKPIQSNNITPYIFRSGFAQWFYIKYEILQLSTRSLWRRMRQGFLRTMEELSIGESKSRCAALANGGADIEWRAKMTFPGRVCKQDVSWSGLRPRPLKCLQRVVMLQVRAPLKPIQYSYWVTLGFIGILSRACATYFLQHRRHYLVFNLRKNLGFRIRQYRTNAKMSKMLLNFENRKPYQSTPLFSILILGAFVWIVSPAS